MTRNSLVRLFAVLALTASACSGDDGAAGAQGPAGPAGADGATGPAGQNGMSPGTGLNLVIDGVATTTADGATTSTITFTVSPASAVCPGGTCDDTLSILGQKTFYATEYDPATRTFPTAKSFNFTGFKFKGLVDGGKGAQYTAKKAGPSFAPETSAHAMIYGYVADSLVLPRKGHYSLYDNVSSASKVYGTIDYVSAATVSGCEKCHGAPYSKHGYRQATVAGLPDMASCKACHTDQRTGTHPDWQFLVDDPAAYATLPATGMTDAQKAKYAYVASTMNDTHMSHAMEFAYPQSMANCVTCHEGKLDVILADEFFTLKTCKSCHPVTGVGGTDAKRAPALSAVIPPIHGSMDLYAGTTQCNVCHSAAGGFPTFKQVHSGRTAAIYAADGSKHSSAVKMTVDTVSFDSATNLLTVDFSVAGADAAAVVKPTVVVSLYGYDTKDFVVSGHGSQSDGFRNLEWAEGSSRNSARLAVLPATATAGNTTWTATADLTTWAGLLTNGTVKKAEIGVLPSLADANGTELAIAGETKTFDLVANAVVADAYGKEIVDTAKCNACHEALGTTFHRPSYGSAGVVGCRLCHVVGSGGSHLEMQSRSIDSYVHAIHSMQPFDIGDVDFTDPVEAMHYEHHVGSTYPNFTILNCESCHNPGTYGVPNQARSLPSVLSAADAVAGRSIGTVPSYVVGPASRACGSCHRTMFINEDDAGSLASFNQHTASFGTLVANGTGILDAVTENIMAQIGGPAAVLTAPAGTTVESCAVCHADAGAEHQAAYDRWADGL